jgi:D-sedoheptulose 7-phosphate isomerase
MQVNLYSKVYNEYFSSAEFLTGQKQAIEILTNSKRIFFIGNGGSSAICSHMMEDYAKIAGFQTFTFSDAAMISCFANDYGYENAIKEWLKIYFTEKDVLVAISSSGNSANIVNGVKEVKARGPVITLSGFEPDNRIKSMGDLNFHIGVSNYGIVECFHQVILHLVLDEIAFLRKASLI